MANHQQRLGKVGLWAFNLDLVPYAQEKEILDEIVSLGFTTLWIPEAVGKEPIAHAALLLANSTTLKVATGIASIWARDAVAAAQAQQTLTEAFPDRFVLGLGVSHAPMVIGVRGQQYEKPYQMMVNYLDAQHGPRDITNSANEDALGGNYFVRGTTELTLPSGLPEEVGIKLHVFADAGTLGGADLSPKAGEILRQEESLRVSVGVGATWQSPFGPIRLDFAQPVIKESYDQTEKFRFSFGTRF